MDKDTLTNKVGKVIFVTVVAFLMLTHNSEITRFIQSCLDFIWGMREVFSSNLEEMFHNDVGMIGEFFLIIFLVIIVFLVVILAIAIGGILWLALKLNTVYLLPFVLPLLIVYSKYSFAFIVRPIIWIPEKLIYLLIPVGKMIGKAFNLFVVLPLAEVVSLRGSYKSKVYRIGISLLFVFGVLSIVIGIGGIIVEYVQDKDILQRTGNAISASIFETNDTENYTIEIYQLAFESKNEFWTDTDIQVKKGDIIVIRATGSATCNSPFKKSESTCGPDGLKGLLNRIGYVTPNMLPREYRYKGKLGYFPTCYIMADKPINSLIGIIGSGKPFCIGKSHEHNSKQNGTIRLGINQVWRSGAWNNNSGSFIVTIEIRRRK